MKKAIYSLFVWFERFLESVMDFAFLNLPEDYKDESRETYLRLKEDIANISSKRL